MHWNRSILFIFLSVGLLSACSDGPTEPPAPETTEVGVVVGSVDLSLTIFDVEDPTQRTTVGLGADGSPVTLAVHDNLAAVPLGVVPAVAVVDLRTAAVVRTVALPEGSGATGAAFVNDSILLVANPNLNSVTPVNVRSGAAGGEIAVGRFPQGIVVQGSRAYVLNAELAGWAPDGPSTVSVIDTGSMSVIETVTLSGQNAGRGVVGPDSRVYVLQAGNWGAGDGSLSVVDPASLKESSHHAGFGDFPGSLAFAPDGILFVGGYGFGLISWDPAVRQFRRGVDNPIAPGGTPSVSGVAFDSQGRLYTLAPDCENPSVVNRLDGAFNVETTIPVGICPFAIAFAEVEAS
ncbi:MAG: hypothetical protein ACE5GJ_12455 [Gemmatimonadota bacterium]